ncbi:MAG: 50S ribosomal protein L25 [Candidatus Eisenbacteria bacterium]|nr:50S ribosomal protein L25 [Candidatus Eisenbacteria bacterium]
MATLNLSAEVRTGRGKGPARQARLAGNVPGVIYGAGEEATALTIPRRELEKALQNRGGGNVIVALKVAGATPPEQMSLIREVQRDPLSGHILHIDFHHISMTEQIDVKIPVHFFGVPNGVKNFGGILEHLSREIEVRCLPGDIPERIQVDVSGLNVHDSIHVRDITVPKAEVLTDGDAVLVTVVPPTVQEEVKPAEGEAPAEPELITKEKGAEGETEEKGKDKDKDKDKK